MATKRLQRQPQAQEQMWYTSWSLRRAMTIITEDRANDLIRAMNDLIHSSNSKCSGVTFVKDGPIHYNSNLRMIGSVSDIADNLDQKEPTANALVVLSMDYCAGENYAFRLRSGWR